MTTLEKAILEKLKKSLVNSTVTTWNSGYLNDWSDWATHMKTTILNSVSIMDALLNEPTELPCYDLEVEKKSETDKN